MGFQSSFYQYDPKTMPHRKTAVVVFGFSQWQVENISSKEDRHEFLRAYESTKAFCNFLSKERPDIAQIFVTRTADKDCVGHPIGFDGNENSISVKHDKIADIKLSEVPLPTDVTHVLLVGNSMLSSIQNLGIQILDQYDHVEPICVADCSVSNMTISDDLDHLTNQGIYYVFAKGLVGTNNIPSFDSLVQSHNVLDNFKKAASGAFVRAAELARHFTL